MALWVCIDCTTVYAVGAPRCPHCQSTEHVEQGEEPMPKITRHGGPTVAGAADSTPAEAAPAPTPDAIIRTKKQLTEKQAKVLAEAVKDGAEPLPFGATVHPVTPRAEEGGESSSPGSSSSASTETPPTVSEPSERPAPKPARTTASRSKKSTASGSAPSTAGEKTDASTTGNGDQ